MDSGRADIYQTENYCEMRYYLYLSSCYLSLGPDVFVRLHLQSPHINIALRERDDQQSIWKLNVCYQMLILKSFFSDFTSNHPGSHGVRLTSSIVSRGGDGTDSGRESKYKFLQFRY